MQALAHLRSSACKYFGNDVTHKLPHVRHLAFWEQQGTGALFWQGHSVMRAAQASDGVSLYDSGEFDASVATIRLPREVVRQMRDTVFGFELRHSLLCERALLLR